MIGTICVEVNSARPQMPLTPCFAFQGSPTSLRIMGVPKKIGDWEITSVKVVMSLPDNTTKEKEAVRTGNVWVSTVDGCETAGNVTQGYSIVAGGLDEDGNEVTGYILGKGDVFVIENRNDIKSLVDKISVRYLEDIPSTPVMGDLIEYGENLRFYDGEKWIVLTTGGEIPTKVSQLENDVGYITESAIPSQVSEFENDAGYITASAIPSDVSYFNNDVGYVTASAIPSKVSELENDSGFITASAIPSDISHFNNDVGYITASAIPSDISSFNNDVGYITASAVPTKVSELENDSGYITASAIPSQVSEFENDAGYITASAIPSNISSFNNDVGYLSAVTWNDVSGKPNIPSNTSDLVNDSGFITASAIPSNVSQLNNDAGYMTAQTVASSYYNKTEVDAKLAQKQDALDEDEITMIGQVTDERKTVITFTDNTSEEYEWSGEIKRQNIVDAGLWDVDHGGWIKEPLSIKIGTAVTRIGNYAFANAHQLTSIDIPSTVTNIGMFCLYDCSALTSITIPYSMKTIGSSTFGMCSSLTSVTIPNSVESIGAGAFDNCTSLSTLLIPDSVTSIGYRAFVGCANLTNLKIPDSVTSIGAGAFWGSGIQNITIGSSVESIGENAFRDASGVTSVVFRGKTLTQVQGMTNYPWQLDTSTISTWNDTSKEYVDGLVGTINTTLDTINGEVEVVTASVSALGSSVNGLTSSVQALGSSLSTKRDYIDLKYPAVEQDGDNGFGISQWSYSFPIQGIGYQGTLDNYTWDGEYGVWSKNNYSPKVRTSDGQNFQFAGASPYDSDWTSALALSQIYPQTTVSLYADTAHGVMDCELTPSFTSTTNLVLENRLSAYATTSALEVVSASVSTLSSQVGANTSSIAGLASSVSAMTSTMAGLESSISAVAGSLNVSGIGCSTVVMSGTYADSTSFAYNVVIQPSA